MVEKQQNNNSSNTKEKKASPKKKLLIFIGITVILLGLLITLFLNYYLEPVVKSLVMDNLKPYFKDNLTIGDIKLQLLKSSLQIKEISLLQPPGFGNGNLAEISTVGLKVQLLPLLQKNLIVDNLSLTNPHFNLIHKENKQSNLDYYINIFKKKALQSEKSASEESLNLDFKKITVRRGTFSYRFPLNSETSEIALKDINFTVNDFNCPNNTKTKSTFKFAAKTVTEDPADISLSGSGVFCAGGLNFTMKNKLSNIVLSEYVYLLPDLKYEVKSGTASVNGTTKCTDGYIVSDQETEVNRLKLGAKSNFSIKGVSANAFLKLLQDKKKLQLGFRVEGDAADLRFSLRESIIESVMRGIGRKFGIGRNKDKKSEQNELETESKSEDKLKDKLLDKLKK